MVKPISQDLLAGIQKIVLSVIFKHLPRAEVLVFLFGSQVSGDNLGASDIDVGLLAATKIESSKLSLIKDEISQQAKTLRKIDIIDFSAVEDKIFLREALRGGKIWHQTSQSKTYLDNLKKRLAA